MFDPRNVRTVFQIRDNLLRVRHLLCHPLGQRFDSDERKICVEWAERRAEIVQITQAYLRDERRAG